ncbi:MAG: class I SAM-dependent methyltransferase [Chitinophagaceae bacterium]
MMSENKIQANWFAEWFDSPYYHVLYQHRSDDEAQAFIQELLQFLNLPKAQRILDVACGKGRHAKAMCDAGHDVCGIDLSPDSIRQANTLANDHLEFFVHDMRQLFRVNYYQVVTNLFTSFGYFNSVHDNTLAARAMARAVVPGGLLVVDFVNRIPACQHIEAHQHETIEREGIRFELHRSYNAQHYIKQIDVYDGEKHQTFFERVSCFTPEQLSAYFIQEGLQVLHCLGNYRCEPFEANSSPRMIFIFQRPHD